MTDIDQQVVEINARLVAARERTELSQGQVSQLLGMSSPGTISHYENGKRRLTVARFLSLCALYKISPIWALTGHNPDFDLAPIMDALADVKTSAHDALNVLQLLESVPHDR